MKRLFALAAIAATTLVLAYCSSAKKAAKAKQQEPKSTYAAHLSTVIQTSCAPCHIPSKGGNKKAYDVFANVKTDIDEMIRRIELNPTEKGFMPFRKTEKLPADVVAVFKKWKEDGMLEN
jgi:uncharacterized membrane protein